MVVQAPGSTVILKSVVGGRVERLSVAPGDRVRAGEAVAELHSHEVLAMEGELLRSAEQSALATRRLEAGRELLAVEGISRMELALREQEAFSAKLAFDTRYEELVDHGVPLETLARILESKTPDAHLPITTPAAGVVLELSVQQHEWVQEYAPLMVIGNPDQIELELQIAPDRASAIAAGDAVEFTPVARPDLVGRGEVLSRVPQVNPDSRTIRIRARIVHSDAPLYPGVFVEGAVLRSEGRRTAVVPEGAVIAVGGRDSVFVQAAPDTFEVRQVELGQSAGGSIEVLGGVEPGQMIVVEGVFFLKSALLKGSGEGE
jgi:cobalt-zinc-cadmium efflux system membrane fusion protein